RAGERAARDESRAGQLKSGAAAGPYERLEIATRWRARDDGYVIAITGVSLPGARRRSNVVAHGLAMIGVIARSAATEQSRGARSRDDRCHCEERGDGPIAWRTVSR